MKFLQRISIILLISTGTVFGNEIQRETEGLIDIQRNTISNIDFTTSNSGYIFVDPSLGLGTGNWPRGTSNQYLFASGLWFAAQKYDEEDQLKKLCVMSYNPNVGYSYMVPGRISDGDEIDQNGEKKYRIYFSTDMNQDGTPENSDDGHNWPIWVNSDNSFPALGFWVDEEERTPSSSILYPKFFSDEDIFCTYKDTDLNYYPRGEEIAKEKGYPLRLQFEQTIFTWADEEKKDMMIVFYKIINTNTDTLYNCWFSPLFDFDIYIKSDSPQGAFNDRCRYVSEDQSLNMGIMWTDTDQGEEGNGFGYMSASFIMSPFVNNGNFIDNGYLTDYNGQIGLSTLRNWTIEDDLSTDELSYDFVSSSIKDNDKGPGERRMTISSGPYHMRPGDTAFFAVLINFALPSKGAEADGSSEDIVNLINNARHGMEFFYNNIVSSITSNPLPNVSLSAFPNPFSETTTISYNLPQADRVTITIFDALGNEIAVPVNEYVPAGEHKAQFNGTHLQSGIYYYSIRIGSDTRTGKMILVK